MSLKTKVQAGVRTGVGYHSVGKTADIQKRLGAAVRRPRLEQGWSQDVFADKSGLHRVHVGEIEHGESNVTLQTLKILADTLGVRIADLVKGL